MNPIASCVLCESRVSELKDAIYADDFWYSIYDPNPVSPGHIILITQKHNTSFFELAPECFESLSKALAASKNAVEEKFHPDGYNLGVNQGTAAGQTLLHTHVHLIPRYEQDVPDPVGGVRNIILGKGRYPTKK